MLMDSVMNSEGFLVREGKAVRSPVTVSHGDRAGELVYERLNNTSRKLLAVLE
jgi:hypothetical protein